MNTINAGHRISEYMPDFFMRNVLISEMFHKGIIPTSMHVVPVLLHPRSGRASCAHVSHGQIMPTNMVASFGVPAHQHTRVNAHK
jgi:hypothetical protein